jgi:hypothetical protein
MMTITGDTVQAAVVAYLKTQTTLTSLITNSNLDVELRERQWQGELFEYPAVRVSLDLFPSLPPCSPEDVKLYLCVYSEQKSSLQCQTIAGVVKVLLHEHPFTQNGIKFSMVKVDKIPRPEKSIYAWSCELEVSAKVN